MAFSAGRVVALSSQDLGLLPIAFDPGHRDERAYGAKFITRSHGPVEPVMGAGGTAKVLGVCEHFNAVTSYAGILALGACT